LIVPPTLILSVRALGRLLHLKLWQVRLIGGAGHCLGGHAAPLLPLGLAFFATFAQSRFEALMRRWHLKAASRPPKAAFWGWMFLNRVFLPRAP
jgi:hypothetical protein